MKQKADRRQSFDSFSRRQKAKETQHTLWSEIILVNVKVNSKLYVHSFHTASNESVCFIYVFISLFIYLKR